MLILAHRPFPALQPYAEMGPIFPCADPCARAGGSELPEISAAPDYIVRGYCADDRIVHGTGSVVATSGLAVRAVELLAEPQVAYLHEGQGKCLELGPGVDDSGADGQKVTGEAKAMQCISRPGRRVKAPVITKAVTKSQSAPLRWALIRPLRALRMSRTSDTRVTTERIWIGPRPL